MCRIAYIPSVEEVGIATLTTLFATLEKKMGGDGNGLAYYDVGGALCYENGVKMTTTYLASLASMCTGPVLFHTRLASSGGVMDALCQPIVKDGVAFVHNGTWHGWTDVAQELILQDKLDANYPINDSVTAAAMALWYGRYSLETIRSGVFVLMENEIAVLHLRGGTFRWCSELGIYASDFHAGHDSKSIADGTIATLLPDGPEFECGGWYKPRTIKTYIAGAVVRPNPAQDYIGKTWNPTTKAWEETGPEPEETEEDDASPQGVAQRVLWELDDQSVCGGCPDQDDPDCYKGRQCPHPEIRDKHDVDAGIGGWKEKKRATLTAMRRILGEEREGGPEWAKDLSDQDVRKFYYQDHEEPPDLESSQGELIGAAACRELLDLSDHIHISDEDVIALYDDYCRGGSSSDFDTETMRKLLQDHYGDGHAQDLDQLSDDEVLEWFTDIEDGVRVQFEKENDHAPTAQDIRNEMYALHGADGLAKMGESMRQQVFDRRCLAVGVPQCQYRQ